eukprot:TRINITY_DN2166_c0_g1_i1.p1 TRINITY_DN2166_c0_g1~~TRINITY_DN2166_c0_g1_i1.p1  ORF type:complete len:176 (-),score=33.98 TRINITY_DN2166_c0_g1_i1:472-999(-)
MSQQFLTITLQIPIIEGSPVNLGLWDTAGSSEYDSLRPLSYPGTDVFLLCFSLGSPATLQSVKDKWWPEMNKHNPGTPFILVGTKLDLRENPESAAKIEGFQPVATDKGEKLSKEIGAFKYCECSALNQKGLPQVFEEAVKAVYHHHVNNAETGSSGGSGISAQDKKKKKDCLVQ